MHIGRAGDAVGSGCAFVICWMYSFVFWGSGLGWKSNFESHSVLEVKSEEATEGRSKA